MRGEEEEERLPWGASNFVHAHTGSTTAYIYHYRLLLSVYCTPVDGRALYTQRQRGPDDWV